MSQNRVSDGFNLPLVSIIVSNWNGANYLIRCLDAILKTKYPNYEVILIDDASTDGSADHAKKHFGANPKLRIIANEKNTGLVDVFNLGFKMSSGKYVVFMHSDAIVDENWLSFLIDAMESDPLIGAAQGKFLSIDDSKTLLSAGHTIDHLGVPQTPVGYLNEDGGQFNLTKETFDAWDACIILRRDVLDEVGLFDPIFKYMHEEIDLCWRIRLAGYKIMYLPKAKIMHKSLTVVRIIPYLSSFHMTKNYLVTLIKNYGNRNLVLYLPTCTILLLIRVLLEAVVANPKYSLASMKGMCWVLLHLKDVWRERLWIQKRIRKVSDAQVKLMMLKPDYRLYFARSLIKKKTLLRRTGNLR